MIVNIKYNINALCKKVLQEQLERFKINYSQLGSTEVDIQDNLSAETMQQLSGSLNEYGFEIVENRKTVLVQKIKDTIIEMIYSEDKLPAYKVSIYIADKLKHNYGYLSSIFSEVTYSTIENFILLQKAERAKQLMITNNLSISEIAWKLNYSSLGHFSAQFKNTTGLKPTAFKKIIEKRRQHKYIAIKTN